jgi:hypothetical protein
VARRLYEQILEISREYMGAAAEDYIHRRIRIVQRGLDPELIQTDRLDRLAAGIDMTAKGYMSAAKAHAFRDAILSLKNRH